MTKRVPPRGVRATQLPVGSTEPLAGHLMGSPGDHLKRRSEETCRSQSQGPTHERTGGGDAESRERSCIYVSCLASAGLMMLFQRATPAA
jgi:hypothetical protein